MLEQELWKAAEAMRGYISATEYRNIITGLLLTKAIGSEQEWNLLKRTCQNSAKKTFRLAKEILKRKKMESLIRMEHGSGFGGANISSDALLQLLNITERISVSGQDSLGKIYEYCLKMFAETEGKNGGEYYTPDRIISFIAEMLEIHDGSTVYDPCCGSGGFFVGISRIADIHAYGQEINPDTWLLAKANAILHNIELDAGKCPDDTLKHDLHNEKKFDFVTSNPPFNLKHKLQKEDPRWAWGIPRESNTNLAWLQIMLDHLSERGMMAAVLTNSSLSGADSSDSETRKQFVENGYVRCIISLPRGLFYSTTLPVCLWIMSRLPGDRTLFMNASSFDGNTRETMLDCWRKFRSGSSVSVRKLAQSADTETIRQHEYALSPSLYIDYSSDSTSVQTAANVTLGQISKWRYGRTGKTKMNSSNNHVPCYSSAGLTGTADKADCLHPSIIVGRKGTLGNPQLVRGPFAASETAFYLEALDGTKADLRYLYHLLKTFNFRALDEGTGAPSLRLETLKSLSLMLPPISYQKSAGKALSRLELSVSQLLQSADSAKNALIELYRSFDFGPCAIKKAQNTAEVKNGITVHEHGEIPWYNIKSMTSPYLVFPAEMRDIPKSRIIPADTVLFSYKLTMGRVAFTTEACAANEAIAAFITENRPFSLWLFCWLSELNTDTLGTSSCLGKAVSLQTVRNIELPVPSDEKLDEFYRLSFPLQQTMKECCLDAAKYRRQYTQTAEILL